MVENKNKEKNLIADKTIFLNSNKTMKSIDLTSSTLKDFDLMPQNLAQKAMKTVSLSATRKVIDSMKMNINAQKTIELMTKNYALEAERQAMQSMSLSSAAQSVFDSMKMNFDKQKTLESMHQSFAQTAMATASLSSVAQNAMDLIIKRVDTQKTFESITRSFVEKAMETVSLSSVAQNVIDSMKTNFNTQKTIELMTNTFAQKSMESISLSSVAQKVMDSLKNNEAFYQSIAHLAQPAYRECAINILNESVLNNSSNLSYENMHFESDALEGNIQKLSGAQNHNTFSSIFAKIPLPVQAIIVFIFLYVIMPQINSILITPYVNEYLSSSKSPDKERIKEISKMNFNSTIFEMDNLRFITRNNVLLRSGPSTKTEILDELCLGQVVTILSKKRNWIEVQYVYQDNEILRGWVFTRYTARFKK